MSPLLVVILTSPASRPSLSVVKAEAAIGVTASAKPVLRLWTKTWRREVPAGGFTCVIERPFYFSGHDKTSEEMPLVAGRNRLRSLAHGTAFRPAFSPWCELQEPHRGIADVPVQRTRRLRERLAFGAPRVACDRWRSVGRGRSHGGRGTRSHFAERSRIVARRAHRTARAHRAFSRRTRRGCWHPNRTCG